MLRDTLTGSMKDAMKAKDQITLSTLRLVNAAIKQQDIDVRASGNEDGIAKSPEWQESETGVRPAVVRALARAWGTKRSRVRFV